MPPSGCNCSPGADRGSRPKDVLASGSERGADRHVRQATAQGARGGRAALNSADPLTRLPGDIDRSMRPFGDVAVSVDELA